MVETNQDYSPESLGHQYLRDENLESKGLEEAAEILDGNSKEFWGDNIIGSISAMTGIYGASLLSPQSKAVQLFSIASTGGFLALTLGSLYMVEKEEEKKSQFAGVYWCEEDTVIDFLEDQKAVLKNGDPFEGPKIASEFAKSEGNYVAIARNSFDGTIPDGTQLDRIEESHQGHEIFEIYRGSENGVDDVVTGYTSALEYDLSDYRDLTDENEILEELENGVIDPKILS